MQEIEKLNLSVKSFYRGEDSLIAAILSPSCGNVSRNNHNKFDEHHKKKNKRKPMHSIILRNFNQCEN